MSEKERKKISSEGKPPVNAGGMVSEDDLLLKEAAEKTRKGEVVELPDTKVLLLFIGEGIYDMNRKMDELLNIFRKAGKPSTKSELMKPIVEPPREQTASIQKSEPKTKVVETEKASPLEIAEGEDRVKEIVDTFAKYSDVVTVDIEANSMFVIVKTKFYPIKNWSEINILAKSTFNATWISQGKESHWKIPKIVKKLKVESRPKPQGPPSDVEGVKPFFTKYLESLLTFVKDGDKVLIKPKQFLGTENFTKIASIVRETGGEYVSEGKNSHFFIPIGAK